jgi:4'-phosphopantetheinyl transferase
VRPQRSLTASVVVADGSRRRAGEAVGVWAATLDVDARAVEQHVRLLSRDELERAMRLRPEAARRQFVVARGTLRRILGGLLDLPPELVLFSYDALGKPSVVSGPCFSASRADDLALYAVDWSGPVGVDLERIRAINVEALSAEACAESERAQLVALPPERRVTAFLGLWTRKEAYLKATGEGLSRSPREVDVSVAPDGWTLLDLTPEAGYAAALATTAPSTAVVWHGRHASRLR